MALNLQFLGRNACRNVRKYVFRSFAMKTRDDEHMMNETIPPGHTLDAVQPPEWFSTTSPEPPTDPMAHVRQPVTSAHMIIHNKVSNIESVTVSPNGNIIHGRFGDLGPQEGIPLEYLALLGPAAEGAAATSKLGHSGTLVVFGATQAAGMAAMQLWRGSAVVAVVGGEHSGEDKMMGIVKGLTKEPGFAVEEEYAMLKKNFSNMVEATANGSKLGAADPQTYLSEFRENALAYSVAYPHDRPAAVGEDHLEFSGKDKDRDLFRENMDPYLAQYPVGSPPLDTNKMEENFNIDQYQIFKSKFGNQTTAVITGDDHGDFSPGHVLSSMILAPEGAPATMKDANIPLEFSLARNDVDVPCEPAGPVAGAIIAVTPYLKVAVKAISAAKTIREKGEALQFLTNAERNSFAAASSVAAQAVRVGAPIYVVGGTLPGFESAEVTDENVKEAIGAMEINWEIGKSRLNYFIQNFRSCDYPVYEDYAVHRNIQGSPYQIIVNK
eukprot:CAMPEP_0194131744 /NCGR_PEP_ID=MMETSP0152-20130528/2436_1 /TAXON_ID=1049557 /ORGANISM="Thalassiothrix antarctica, Strain L6-D1" /LENGTH=495 /DNA_ID=CAMNT_0038826615 /DNA_START=33 /DNA_END=1520 /DNA_ORIENTATION=+